MLVPKRARNQCFVIRRQDKNHRRAENSLEPERLISVGNESKIVGIIDM